MHMANTTGRKQNKTRSYLTKLVEDQERQISEDT